MARDYRYLFPSEHKQDSKTHNDDETPEVLSFNIADMIWESFWALRESVLPVGADAEAT